MLDQGMVPTARVAPFLRRYLEDSEDPCSDAHGSLPRILKRWENDQEWAEFSSVDRIFCQISDAPLMMWREIEDVYYGVNLDAAVGTRGVKYCEREGCGNILTPKRHHGGRAKKYCSKVCRRAAHSYRCEGVIPAVRRIHACPHGHEKTGENWVRIKNGPHAGKWYCAPCNRRKSADQRAKAKAARSVTTLAA